MVSIDATYDPLVGQDISIRLVANYDVNGVICPAEATTNINVIQETEIPNQPFIEKQSGQFLPDINNTNSATYNYFWQSSHYNESEELFAT